MLRHVGPTRTYLHNIRLAGLLSLTAGFVNVSGFIAFAVLTTNVTGHVAVFADKLSQGDFNTARSIGVWMFLFFFGAFISSLIVDNIGRNKRYSYTISILIEMAILFITGSRGYLYPEALINTEVFTGGLLFAMGLQNAMVSIISGSVVRTTHLTGMFTDLGIESAALFHVKQEYKTELIRKIKLRLVIIGCFFLGGIAGGLLFKKLHFHTFYIPVGILIIVLFYDIFRLRTLRIFRAVKRKYIAHEA